ncbi:MAG: hypothetical protein ILA29_04290 [Prevotella sp.]|nr:hypothetical protein [Prevotella sp.]
MAKNKPTPLKDEPLAQMDDVCNKIDNLTEVVNRQNGFLQEIAKEGGYNSEYKFLCNEFNVRQTLKNALGEYLFENNKRISNAGEEDTKLAKAKQLLEEYKTALQEAKCANSKGNVEEAPSTTVVIHEAAPSYINQPQRPEQPQSAKGMFAYLFFRLPWYHIRCFFASSYFKHWLIIIMACLWFVSICLTCIMAVDNARMHQVYRAVLMHVEG